MREADGAPGAGPPQYRFELRWDGERRFECHGADYRMSLDGAAAAGPTPMQAVVLGLGGCMGIDVLHVLERGRHAIAALSVEIVAERLQDVPRRFAAVRLHFTVATDAPSDRIARAIALSRERYCSVWHSLRPDIALETSFTVSAPA